jgi:hypothetical protein
VDLRVVKRTEAKAFESGAKMVLSSTDVVITFETYYHSISARTKEVVIDDQDLLGVPSRDEL